MDLIDRQKAIEYVDCGHLRPPTELAWSDLDVVNMLKKLPSAEPNLQPTCNQLATDCISRQDAIDAICTWDKFGVDERGRLVWWYEGLEPYVHLRDVVFAIEKLPSAEPVIRCKDCKHMIINEKHEAKPMICCFTKMCGTTEPDWFCADGERRDDE